MTEESKWTTTAVGFLLIAVVAAAALAGCTSSAPDSAVDDNDGKARDKLGAYAGAYSDGMGHHGLAQEYFNSATMAWDEGNLRQAIADYANASMEYDAAADCYGRMAGHAGSLQDEQFGDSLRGCTFNLSLAADRFMNSAIAMGTNDTGKATTLFEEGLSRVDDSDKMLNRSVELTPGWMRNMTSG